MDTVRFLKWILCCDQEKTRIAYAFLEAGGAEECGCDPCLNFIALRERVYPPEVLGLFETLGIDPKREAEVHHHARLESGLHSYGGWFHFVGEIESGGECWKEKGREPQTPTLEPVGEHFALGFSTRSDLAGPSFADLPLVQLEFIAQVPWISERPEPS